MADSSPNPPASTFVVRFWRESSAVGSRWRARIEHLQSGESASYLNLQGISEFMHRLGIGIENAGVHGDADE
jgi:hypothetical protein